MGLEPKVIFTWSKMLEFHRQRNKILHAGTVFSSEDMEWKQTWLHYLIDFAEIVNEKCTYHILFQIIPFRKISVCSFKISLHSFYFFVSMHHSDGSVPGQMWQLHSMEMEAGVTSTVATGSSGLRAFPEISTFPKSGSLATCRTHTSMALFFLLF